MDFHKHTLITKIFGGKKFGEKSFGQIFRYFGQIFRSNISVKLSILQILFLGFTK